MARRLIAGNWKMNGLTASLAEAEAVIEGLSTRAAEVDCLICPPATLIGALAAKARGTQLNVGAQTCHRCTHGAHTGDISAHMVAEFGASHVIVGHSERRAAHGETDDEVAEQAQAACEAGLVPIICVGESLAERKAGDAAQIVSAQITASWPELSAVAPIAVAYEPIWAIGTGLTPTLDEIEEIHTLMRDVLKEKLGEVGASATPLLYGGSMKPTNAAGILKRDNVDGGLIGGASLKAADFLAIYDAAV